MDISKLTKQQVFDLVVAGLHSQGYKRSVSEDGLTCRYRGAYGRKCSIGHLIDDEEYEKRMEFCLWGHQPALRKVLGLPLGYNPLFALLEDLQHAHDFAESPTDMRDKLRNVAASHVLLFNEPV